MMYLLLSTKTNTASAAFGMTVMLDFDANFAAEGMNFVDKTNKAIHLRGLAPKLKALAL